MTYNPPHKKAVIHFLTTGKFMMEHRGGETLLWDHDWWHVSYPKPFAVLKGEHPNEVMELWAAAWLAGMERGQREGHQKGFAACQTGLRSLLGC